MTKLPIPDDWDGESWRCIQVQWPDSLQWSVILNGVMTGLTRGRVWDERSGMVTEAQAVGSEIWSRNFPYTLCGGDEQTQDEIIQIINAGGCGLSALEGWQMACLDLTNLIKIEDGKLWVRDSCCEWHEVTSDGGGLSSGGGASGSWEEPPDIDWDETDVYPCGMATGCAEMLKDLGEYIWDNAPIIPTIFMPLAAQNHVNLDLNNAYVIAATNQALIMQGLVVISEGIIDLEESDVIESDWIDEVKCALLPVMGSDGSVDADTLINTFKAWVIQHYPSSGESGGNNLFIQNYWNGVVNAVGKGNLADCAQSNMFEEMTCDCAGYGSIPDKIEGENGWYLGAEKTVLLQGTGGFTHGYGSVFDTPEHNVYGAYFKFEFVSGDPIANLKRANECALTPDVCMTTSNSDEFDVGVDYLQAGPIAYDALDQYLNSPEQENLAGYTSDVVGSPLSDVFDTVEHRFGARASGDEGVAFNTVRVRVRWLHNYGSASHQ